MSEKFEKPVNTAVHTPARLPEAKQAGDAYVTLPDGRNDGWLHSHSRQTIQLEPQKLYELWKDEAGYALWMEHVISVAPIGDGRSHWVMGDPEEPAGKRIEFDSVVTEDVPGEKLAWNTVKGEPDQHGEVTFAARRDGRGTVVTLVQKFKIGAVANTIAGVVERSPKQTMIETLRHFKQMAETGEIPSAKGNAHGPRGIGGGIRKWMLGETNPTPKGTSEAAGTAL